MTVAGVSLAEALALDLDDVDYWLRAAERYAELQHAAARDSGANATA